MLPRASVGWWREPQVPPLRFAPVGMTIHILIGVRVPKKDCYTDKKVTTSQDDGFVGSRNEKQPKRLTLMGLPAWDIDSPRSERRRRDTWERKHVFVLIECRLRRSDVGCPSPRPAGLG
jgi:hypothetical protein